MLEIIAIAFSAGMFYNNGNMKKPTNIIFQLVTDFRSVFSRLIVGFVFLSEGIQKFLFPDLVGIGRLAFVSFPGIVYAKGIHIFSIKTVMDYFNEGSIKSQRLPYISLNTATVPYCSKIGFLTIVISLSSKF